MNGSPYARLGLAYRPKPKKTPSVVTLVAFTCVACTVTILFWQGHNSVMRMHSAMRSPTMEQPAGWATLHKTTTVQSATVTITGSEITGSALTATTTELRATGTVAETTGPEQAASHAAATADAVAATQNNSSFSGSLTHMLGDLQHSLHTLLTVHAGWKPGSKITRAQLAAVAAASMPNEDRDIELHSHKVAQVVGKAKAAQQLQRLAQGGAPATASAADGAQDEPTSAEAFAGLYGAGGGRVSFTVASDRTTCPQGPPSPGAAQTAVLLLGGNSTAALKRSLDGLLLLYSRASPDVRSAFHLYVALDSSSSEEIRAVALSYVHDTMGAVKLVQQGDIANSRSSSSDRGRLKGHAPEKAPRPEQQRSAAAVATNLLRGTGSASDAGGTRTQITAAGRRLLASTPAVAAAASLSSSGKQPGHQHNLLKQKQQRQQGKQHKPDPKAQKQQQVQATHNAAGVISTPAPKSSATAGSAGSSSAVKAPQPAPAQHTNPNHIQLMLHVFFQCSQYPSVLLLQDDLKLAPDFLEFFYFSYWLLASDPSLYCLSAWNPQGHQLRAVHPTRIMRTDYHPGKAWLINRDLGLYLVTSTPNWQEPKLEAAAWHGGKNGAAASHDGLVQLLQGDVIRKGRQCLVPEMPRVVLAGVNETFEGAHIHNPNSSAKKFISGQEHAMLGAADYTIASSEPGGSSSYGSDQSSSPEEGAVDMEAYGDYDMADDNIIADPSAEQSSQDGLSILELKHGLSTNAGDSGAHHQQQGGTAGCAIAGCRLWLHQDLSVLLADTYELHMYQALHKARMCDVAAAAVVTNTHTACVVSYNASTDLAATSHRLGIPVVIQHGFKYCYDLPQATAASAKQQHCQDYLPEMAYKGIVSGYNHHSARVFLVHARYIQALKQWTRTASAASTAASNVSGKKDVNLVQGVQSAAAKAPVTVAAKQIAGGAQQ